MPGSPVHTAPVYRSEKRAGNTISDDAFNEQLDSIQKVAVMPGHLAKGR
jgi:hypothetical protein